MKKSYMIVSIVINVDTYPPQIPMCMFTNKLCMKKSYMIVSIVINVDT